MVEQQVVDYIISENCVTFGCREAVSIHLFASLAFLALTSEIVQTSAEVRNSEGLLTNDSFIVACMRTQGLRKLATANGDFDQVSGVDVYKPTDLREG